ncbi:OmpA family protein [Maridesulfovibrio ferrireducens]|uniref:OmpA/MotB family protein n=1 Tax=Maridesulfovibrio ferrireducens TaxID=246191 RepID=UPI001A2E0CBA|nr:OmpA family protein [Maridesulfovibrio ferrireducens]MBI9113198.1 OmpA family protein [Maridesulfovibrio ferrireducens]
MPIFNSPRLRHSESSSDENPYWMSFSDIMAGLLVIFILACVVLLLQLMEIKNKVQFDVEDLQKANQIRQQLIEEIAKRLEQEGVTVEVSDNHTVLRIPDKQLYFKTNSAEIQPEHKRIVSEIGRVLYVSISDPKKLRYLDTIFIEGHTDSRRAKRFPMGNWGLSAFRAISIWTFWTEKTDYGNGLKELRNSHGKPLFSVSGYAASRKVEQQEVTANQRRKNRRIDIRFTTRQPSEKEYKAVLDFLPGD